MSKSLIVAFLFISLSVVAQTNGFIRTWGDVSKSEFATAVVESGFGGAYLAGHTGSNQVGNDDVFLTLTDQHGAALFTRYFGGALNERVKALSIGPDGVFICGYAIDRNTGNQDNFLIKTDFSGNTIWQTGNTSASENAITADVSATTDGGCIALVNIDDPLIGNVIRYDATGSVSAIETFPGEAFYTLETGAGATRYTLSVINGQIKVRKTSQNDPSSNWSSNLTGSWATSTALDMAVDVAHHKIAIINRVLETLGDAYLTVFDEQTGSQLTQVLLDNSQDNTLVQFDANGHIIVAYTPFIDRFDAQGNPLSQNNPMQISNQYAMEINGLKALSDGRLLAVGTTTLNLGGKDAALAILDSSLNIESFYDYGIQAPSHRETGWMVRRAPDGGYIMAGENYFENKRADFELIKLDAEGYIQWANHYGSSDTELARSVNVTPDGGYVMSGFHLSSAGILWKILKTDANGLIIWDKEYSLGQVSSTTSSVLSPHPDGGFYGYATGSLSGASNTRRPLIIRVNDAGDTLWTRKVGTFPSNQFRNLLHTSDGGYAAVGIHNQGAWQIKLNDEGQIQWEKSQPGGFGYGVTKLTDGSIVFAGARDEDSDGIDSVFVSRYTLDGTLIFTRFFNLNSISSLWSRIEANASNEIWLSVNNTPPNESKTGMAFVKLDASGNTMALEYYQPDFDLFTFDGTNAHDGGRIVTGNLEGYNSQDYLLIKTNPSGIVESSTVLSPRPQLTVGPSPSAGDVTLNLLSEQSGKISIRLFDMNGRCVFEFFTEKNEPQFGQSFDLKNLTNGTYFWQLCINNQCAGAQWIKMN